LAAQRDELLQHFGRAERFESVSVRDQSVREEHESVHVKAEQVHETRAVRKYAPKPAAAAADQFRKLRRDAKRKAIGV
jgi:predicted Fe-Mo cluster-binding NifX family protein